MDSTAETIGRVVAILTAILSEQEEVANELLMESNPVELFGCMTGILLSALTTIAEANRKTVQEYLQEIGMTALKHS
jgi:galactitol-specific phosphotransferase system IIC component